MDELAADPAARMKPQRGRRIDTPTTVLVVPAARVSGGMRWRLLGVIVAASAAAAALSVAVISFIA